MRPVVTVTALCLLLVGCADAPQSPAVEDLGALGKADTLRQVTLTLAAGATKHYRIKATGFHAELTQTTAVLVQLSAKHYELESQGTPDLAPTLEVEGDGTLRNWTLRVTNLGATELEGEVVVTSLAAPDPEPELGIVSDIDKTLLPPAASGAPLPPPYPGVAKLLQLLELGAGDQQAGDMYFVTARDPGNLTGLPQWMQDHGIPAGPIEPGVTSGFWWAAEAEKVKDISAIFDANPQQRFVLLGDTNHRDPEVMKQLQDAYGDRVVVGLVHKVNNPNPDRLLGLELVENYAQAAAVLYRLEVLDEQGARSVMLAAQQEGLAITAAEIDALIAANQPSKPFVGNTQSKTFHRHGCQYYFCASCTVQFATREEAIQAGYTPCGKCHP
jgi:hypothetical protein